MGGGTNFWPHEPRRKQPESRERCMVNRQIFQIVALGIGPCCISAFFAIARRSSQKVTCFGRNNNPNKIVLFLIARMIAQYFVTSSPICFDWMDIKKTKTKYQWYIRIRTWEHKPSFRICNRFFCYMQRMSSTPPFLFNLSLLLAPFIHHAMVHHLKHYKPV